MTTEHADYTMGVQLSLGSGQEIRFAEDWGWAVPDSLIIVLKKDSSGPYYFNFNKWHKKTKTNNKLIQLKGLCISKAL